MRRSLVQAILPLFLFLCLLLGGSSQSGGSLPLQIAAAALIAWVASSASPEKSSGGRVLLGLLIAILVLIGLQITPLPPSWWRSLPGRESIEAGYLLLEMQMPPLPISLTPYETLAALLYLLPPTAVLLAMLRLGTVPHSWLIVALFAGSLLGILLGFVQVVTGSSWYIYERTNVGAAVGFFANRNHMGTLLLMTLPFVVCLFNREKADLRRGAPLKFVGGGLLLAILLSLAVNGSLAAVVLLVPVVLASALLLPGVGRFRAWLGGAAVVTLTAAMAFLADSAVRTKLTGQSTTSFETRWDFWQRTWSAIENSWPVGTGLGSFDAVYETFEPPYAVTTTFVNHAHNDYLEVLLETGLTGAVLLVAFFGWWVGQAIRIFKSSDVDPIAGAAVIASGAVLAHSVVDYPLRTAAIAATFALCVGLMAIRRGHTVIGNGNSGRARHLKIG